jgi:hypothetical protein
LKAGSALSKRGFWEGVYVGEHRWDCMGGQLFPVRVRFIFTEGLDEKFQVVEKPLNNPDFNPVEFDRFRKLAGG